MKAFLKTLFGDAATLGVVGMIVATEVVLVAFCRPALVALVIPVVVLAGIAWLATD